MKNYFYILLLLLVTQAFGQSEQLDSLKEAYKIAGHDTARCSILATLTELEGDDSVWAVYNEELKTIAENSLKKYNTEQLTNTYKKYFGIAIYNEGFISNQHGDINKAIDYFHQSLKIHEEVGFYRGVANSLNNIGFIYMNKGEIDKALDYYNRSLIIQEKIKDREGVANLLNNIGYIYKSQWNISKAIEYYMRSMKIREEIGDKRGIGNSLNNIGVIYGSQGENEKALEYYEKSLKIREQTDDRKGVATVLNNIGGSYKTKKNYEKALEYFNRSLAIREKMQDKHGIAQSYMNIGSIFEAKEDYDNALQYYAKSLKMEQEVEDKKGVTIVLGSIAGIKYKQGKPDEARIKAEEGLKLAQELGFPEHISSTSELLSKIYAERGEYKKAYTMHTLFKQMTDSINNESNKKAALRKEFQYKYEKKAAADSVKAVEEHKLFDSQLSKQKSEKRALYIGIALIALFSIFLYNRFRLISRQKGIIEKQKKIVESKNHEITLSIQYAQKIQEALLPSAELIRQIFTNSFVLFKPKDIVSGDFYWISDRGKYVYYATVDCTGHGVPGGFMSMLGISLLNEIIDEMKMEDCGEVLNTIREKIIISLKQIGDSESRDGMDIVLIRLEKKTLEIQYAAANNSLYIVSSKQSAISNEYCLLQTTNGQLFELPCDKMPVGVYHGEIKPFRTFTQQLQKGDIIYTYTDGYADQFGGQNVSPSQSLGMSRTKKYTYKKLREKLLSISQEPLEKQKDILETEFENWKEGQEQIDDVCMIAVKV